MPSVPSCVTLLHHLWSVQTYIAQPVAFCNALDTLEQEEYLFQAQSVLPVRPGGETSTFMHSYKQSRAFIMCDVCTPAGQVVCYIDGLFSSGKRGRVLHESQMTEPQNVARTVNFWDFIVTRLFKMCSGLTVIWHCCVYAGQHALFSLGDENKLLGHEEQWKILGCSLHCFLLCPYINVFHSSVVCLKTQCHHFVYVHPMIQR